MFGECIAIGKGIYAPTTVPGLLIRPYSAKLHAVKTGKEKEPEEKELEQKPSEVLETTYVGARERSTMQMTLNLNWHLQVLN